MDLMLIMLSAIFKNYFKKEFNSFFLHFLHYCYDTIKRVMKMRYIVLAYKEEYCYLLERYKNIKTLLINLNESDPYLKAVKDNYFVDISFLDQYIFNELSTRRDYERKEHVHILRNILTGKKTTLEIKNNKIYIESADKNNIFFYIIYQKLKNYVIIDKNL